MIISTILCAFTVTVFKFVLERIGGLANMKPDFLPLTETRKIWRIKGKKTHTPQLGTYQTSGQLNPEDFTSVLQKILPQHK